MRLNHFINIIFFKENINREILIKNFHIFFMVFFVLCFLTNYFFSVFVGFGFIFFIFIIEYLFLYFRIKDGKENIEEIRKDIKVVFIISPISIIVIISIFNFLEFPYYMIDFNKEKKELSTVTRIVSSQIVGSNQYKKPEKYFVINNNKSEKLTNSQTFQLNYPHHKLMDRKLELPIGERIEVIYLTTYNGNNKPIFLAYDVKTSGISYIEYQDSLRFFQENKRKSFLFLTISMASYTLSIFFSFIFMLYTNRRNV